VTSRFRNTKFVSKGGGSSQIKGEDKTPDGTWGAVFHNSGGRQNKTVGGGGRGGRGTRDKKNLAREKGSMKSRTRLCLGDVKRPF